jgi:hypothetical protein
MPRWGFLTFVLVLAFFHPLDQERILFWFNILTQLDWDYLINRLFLIVSMGLACWHISRLFAKLHHQFQLPHRLIILVSFFLAMCAVLELYSALPHHA